MSKLLTGKTTYNPNEEYYFVDYTCLIDTRWVRSPYMSIEEVQECISNLPYVYDEENKQTFPMFKELRITPHSILNQLARVYNEKEDKWDNSILTNAIVQFDDRYDCPEVVGMKPSLTKQVGEDSEDWKARVDKRAEEDKIERRNNFEEDIRLKKVWKGYATEGTAYLVGKRFHKKEVEDARNAELEAETA